jgi:hypothetical protein
MAIITIRVDEDLKRRMETVGEINWSEFVRGAIRRRLDLEESLRRSLDVDRDRIDGAIRVQDRIRGRTSGEWSGAEEIRRWRDSRR